jgi:hypothetical protein
VDTSNYPNDDKAFLGRHIIQSGQFSQTGKENG